VGGRDTSSDLVVRSKGELKDLETGKIFPDFTLQTSSTAYFSRFGDINGDAEYWQPVVANHTPGDSYIPGKGLILQMSVGESHEINAKGVEDLLGSGAFGPQEDQNVTERIKFVFVLHSDVGDKYGLQHLKFTDKPKHKGAKKHRADNIANRIHQYSFTTDLEERLNTLRKRRQASDRPKNERWMPNCVTKTGDFQEIK
jgi:hypothetical protein